MAPRAKAPHVKAAQAKAMKKNDHHVNKAKPYASQDHFSADYVLTWNRFGKIVVKYVGSRTNNTLLKSSVWVPKTLIANAKGPKQSWVPKTKA
uniref:Uncharacterized protein n=1 Tax=Arundo donax TaxID=35708 RepID=A0A0A9FVV6_ARUDO